jgi:DNA-binding transcriptional ArsR family regulator
MNNQMETALANSLLSEEERKQNVCDMDKAIARSLDEETKVLANSLLSEEERKQNVCDMDNAIARSLDEEMKSAEHTRQRLSRSVNLNPTDAEFISVNQQLNNEYKKFVLSRNRKIELDRIFADSLRIQEEKN